MNRVFIRIQKDSSSRYNKILPIEFVSIDFLFNTKTTIDRIIKNSNNRIYIIEFVWNYINKFLFQFYKIHIDKKNINHYHWIFVLRCILFMEDLSMQQELYQKKFYNVDKRDKREKIKIWRKKEKCISLRICWVVDFLAAGTSKNNKS